MSEDGLNASVDVAWLCHQEGSICRQPLLVLATLQRSHTPGIRPVDCCVSPKGFKHSQRKVCTAKGFMQSHQPAASKLCRALQALTDTQIVSLAMGIYADNTESADIDLRHGAQSLQLRMQKLQWHEPHMYSCTHVIEQSHAVACTQGASCGVTLI